MKSRMVQIILSVLLYLVLAVLMIMQVSDVLDFSFLIENKAMLLKATWTTLYLSIFAMLSSMVIGFMLFLLTESSSVFLKVTAGIYKEIIMGTPLLVLVFVVVYIIGVALGIRNKMMLGFLAITLYMSPYMTNAFDGAYRAIDKSQFMVMDFYGFSIYQKYRYILLPQMIRPIVPSLINNLSGIIKGTSILSTIAISEIFYTTSVLSNQSYRYIEGYFVLWMVYLLITIPLSRLAKYLTKAEVENGH
ncbi:ABC transporter permease subunit [Acidaminobacter sp. JC074]|uniref:amino acid ABC transporter permease n=1 Tax=Acidaminobacter sp. JC074 TaxID=2530199 RepID=UPI001F1063FD|nr:ABC transporter permease subunit [Acidaminobacter sp. JC074]MCH4891128.1 ABC transporter permease subunit [Acidaminobacter sp. JC074]